MSLEFLVAPALFKQSNLFSHLSVCNVGWLLDTLVNCLFVYSYAHYLHKVAHEIFEIRLVYQIFDFFRWFKCKAHEKFRLTIWDNFLWNLWVKFGHNVP